MPRDAFAIRDTSHKYCFSCELQKIHSSGPFEKYRLSNGATCVAWTFMSESSPDSVLRDKFFNCRKLRHDYALWQRDGHECPSYIA